MGHGDSQTENALYNRLILLPGYPFGRQKDIEIEGRKPLVSGCIDLQVRDQLQKTPVFLFGRFKSQERIVVFMFLQKIEQAQGKDRLAASRFSGNNTVTGQVLDGNIDILACFLIPAQMDPIRPGHGFW